MMSWSFFATGPGWILKLYIFLTLYCSTLLSMHACIVYVFTCDIFFLIYFLQSPKVRQDLVFEAKLKREQELE